jgi:hypothetical protein
VHCQGIQQNLSAYLDHQLSSDEIIQVEEHLRTCQKCRFSLEELKKIVARVQGLEDKEPPPWLEQRIMAQVREEAGRKRGILQKLFYPLHIKVPLQAVATLAIAVTAFFLYRSLEPEIKVAEAPPQQDTVVTEEAKEKPVEEKFFADKQAPSRVPGAPAERIDKKTDAISEQRRETKMDRAPEAETGEISRFRAADEQIREKPEPQAFEAEELRKAEKQQVIFIIQTDEIRTARSKVEQAITELNGTVIKTESVEQKDIIIAELSAHRVNEFSEKLRRVGEIEETKTEGIPKTGMLEIRVELMIHSAPAK